jgi:hypothetical protein
MSLWESLGEATAEREIEPLLAGSPAGDLLQQMKRHHAA